jgi:hypothetical protein
MTKGGGEHAAGGTRHGRRLKIGWDVYRGWL